MTKSCFIMICSVSFELVGLFLKRLVKDISYEFTIIKNIRLIHFFRYLFL